MVPTLSFYAFIRIREDAALDLPKSLSALTSFYVWVGTPKAEDGAESQ